MITAAAILEIIRLSLAITLEVVKDMPPDQKQAAWALHARWQDYWQARLDHLKETA